VFSVVAYSESQDSATLVNIAAVADTLYRTSGDDLFVPRAVPNLAGYLFLGANFTQGQLFSPSIRRRLGGDFDVDQADLVDEPASPTNFVDYFDRPFPLVAGEQLRTLMAEDAAGASRVSAILFLSDGPAAPIEGDIITIRATGTTTLVANAWTVGSITLASTLPAGRYALVGARVQAAGLRAARFVSQDATFRPGVIGCDSDGDIGLTRFRNGNLGSWLEFEHDEPPQVEYFSASADTAETLVLDLISVREGVGA
jgi:hypothetical protein